MALTLPTEHPNFSLETELLCLLPPQPADHANLDAGEGAGATRADLARDLFDSSRQDGLAALIPAANRRYLQWLAKRGIAPPSDEEVIEGLNLFVPGQPRKCRALRLRCEHWTFVFVMCSQYMHRVYGNEQLPPALPSGALSAEC